MLMREREGHMREQIGKKGTFSDDRASLNEKGIWVGTKGHMGDEKAHVGAKRAHVGAKGHMS